MDLPFRYVLIGLVWLVVAMIEGLWMAIAGATQYTTLHVIMVLAGGVTGILFGTVMRAWPKVASDAWANWQFLAWNIGVLITAIGAITRTWGHGDAIIAVGSIVMLVAGVMLLVIFQRSGKQS